MSRLRIFTALAALVVAAGCSLSSPTTSAIDGPGLTGPSTSGLSIVVSAQHDVLPQDGSSWTMIYVKALDPNGQPVRNLPLRLSMYVGQTLVDYGTLSAKAISTDNSGMATTVYTVPPAPPIAVDNDTTVVITALPDGRDFANTLNNTCSAPTPITGFCTPPNVSIRLVTPGVILGPNPTVSASFSFSPAQPEEDQQVQFDASSSTGANLTYAWAFGDGKTGTGVRPTHTYSVSGTYGVILTVTDDRGTSASSTPINVQIAAAEDPTADFVISPTDPSINTDVFFDGSLSKTPLGTGRTIVSYDWNFGDGASGSGQKASHQYGKAGTYTIVLNVKDSSGRRGTVSKNLQVK